MVLVDFELFSYQTTPKLFQGLTMNANGLKRQDFMVYIGIDIGKTGAVGVVYKNQALACYSELTESGGIDYVANASKITSFLIPWNHLPMRCAIEEVLEMPGQNIRTNTVLSKSFGMWAGIMACLKVPTIAVHARIWKKKIFEISGTDKQESILKAEEIYPNLNFSKKKDHNLAEAILIAHWLKEEKND